MKSVIVLLISIAMLFAVDAFVPVTARNGLVQSSDSALFAHHVNDKVVKRKMARRPRKSRPSDVSRNNQNDGKCITKVEGAPSDYTMVSSSEADAVKAAALNFWSNGDSEAEWLEITAEDMEVVLPSNIDPLPEGGVQKKPPLVRSGSY